MLKPASLHNRISHRSITWSEGLLLLSAAILGVAALVTIEQSPLAAVSMLLAAAAVSALVYERTVTRRTLQSLAEQLDTTGPVSKLEVAGSGTHELGQALNRAIQRTRVEALDLPQAPAAPPAVSHEISVAVLSVGLRAGGVTYSAAHSDRLAAIVRAARVATRSMDVTFDVHGDGTVVLIFGGNSVQPMRQSLHEALDVSRSLARRFKDARFGLSCGKARACTLSETGPTFIGAPVEDAVRLARMAIAWHEYHLLCAEPIALLARSFSSRRTTLELTYAAAPMLPIYALSLDPGAVALSA